MGVGAKYKGTSHPQVHKKKENDKGGVAGMGSGEGWLISEARGNERVRVPKGYSSAPSPGGFFAYFFAETRK